MRKEPECVKCHEPLDSSNEPSAFCSSCIYRVADVLAEQTLALAAENAQLLRDRERCAQIAADMIESVEDANRVARNRGKGGQQITETGEFVHLRPSALSAIHRYGRELRMATSGAEVHLATLQPEMPK
jgi:CTP-dependent riboflavin kinase